MTATVSPINRPLPDLTDPQALAASWHLAHGAWRDNQGRSLHDLVHNALGHEQAEQVWREAIQLFEDRHAARWSSPAIPRQHRVNAGGAW